jgi:hypothetical protein
MFEYLFYITVFAFLILFVVAIHKGLGEEDKEEYSHTDQLAVYLEKKRRLIEKIQRKGFMKTYDGRNFHDLTLAELESECRRLCKIGG